MPFCNANPNKDNPLCGVSLFFKLDSLLPQQKRIQLPLPNAKELPKIDGSFISIHEFSPESIWGSCRPLLLAGERRLYLFHGISVLECPSRRAISWMSLSDGEVEYCKWETACAFPQIAGFFRPRWCPSGTEFRRIPIGLQKPRPLFLDL